MATGDGGESGGRRDRTAKGSLEIDVAPKERDGTNGGEMSTGEEGEGDGKLGGTRMWTATD